LKAKKRNRRRIGSGLVALSSAAVLTVYTAGYLRTRAAAQRFAGEAAERRPAVPIAVYGPVGAAAPAPISPEARMPADPAQAPPPTVVPRHPETPAATRPAAAKSATAGEIKETHQATEPAPRAHDVAPPATAEVAPVSPAPQPAAAAAETTTAESDHRATEVPAAPSTKAPTAYKDGTYTGWGTSRHGDIQAAVVIEGGRIVSATIAQCLTRYSCSWIAPLPPQVVTRQSAEVDYVSGATQSTNAFYYAVLEALAKAK
jgi:uncharacterized protein with FMN-binding domain